MTAPIGQTAIERVFGAGALPAMIARPGFPRAMKVAAKAAMQRHQHNWLSNRLLNDRGRYLASMLVLDLHFNANGGIGFTTAEVRREVVAQGVCSAGRASAFLAGLRFGKFIQPMPRVNQKEKRLGPTELFLDTHRQRWTVFMSALREMDPDLAARGQAAPDSLLFGPALNVLADCLRQGVRVFDLAPQLRDYAERECGFVLLLTLLALEEGEALPALRASRLYSISRTHASGLLRRAAEDGLATSGPEGYVAGEALLPAMEMFFGLSLLVFERAFVVAEASVRPSAGAATSDTGASEVTV